MIQCLFPISTTSPVSDIRRGSNGGPTDLSRLACSQRTASLRLGVETDRFAVLVSSPRPGPSVLLATAQRFYVAALFRPILLTGSFMVTHRADVVNFPILS